MHHVAIMKKSWGLLPRILSGDKVIESRWYRDRRAPWGNIYKGDTVYFKNGGEPVTVAAEVERVLEFSDLTPTKVRELLSKYGDDDGISRKDRQKYFELFKDKRYCIPVFLKDAEKVAPFEIDKEGFGAMAAWITVLDVKRIKIKQKASSAS